MRPYRDFLSWYKRLELLDLNIVYRSPHAYGSRLPVPLVAR